MIIALDLLTGSIFLHIATFPLHEGDKKQRRLSSVSPEGTTAGVFCGWFGCCSVRLSDDQQSMKVVPRAEGEEWRAWGGGAKIEKELCILFVQGHHVNNLHACLYDILKKCTLHMHYLNTSCQQINFKSWHDCEGICSSGPGALDEYLECVLGNPGSSHERSKGAVTLALFSFNVFVVIIFLSLIHKLSTFLGAHSRGLKNQSRQSRETTISLYVFLYNLFFVYPPLFPII